MRMDPRNLLSDMYSTTPDAAAAQRATLTGGIAAMVTLFAYPPAAHLLWLRWQQTGYRPDPRPQLMSRWVTAVTGSPPQQQALRRLVAGDKRHAEFPPEVDRDRFGSRYQAGDPVHRAAAYAIVCTLMLAAQERMYRQLDAAERDAYCAGCAATAGSVLGLGRRAPSDYARLRASYETIVATRLQGTSFGRAALAAMLDGSPPTPLPATLIRQAAQLADDRALRHLGLGEAPARAAAHAVSSQAPSPDQSTLAHMERPGPEELSRPA